MNRYGTQAMRHWQAWLPDRFTQIPDPTTFFTRMGQEIADEITDLSADLATREPFAGTYLAEVGRLNRIRQQAEEQILQERVFLTPAIDSPETDSPTGTTTPS